jgi:hypothetical protein
MTPFDFGALQALLRSPDFSPPPAASSLAFSGWAQGLPVGALTQIRGRHATAMVLKFLEEHPELRAAWVEERMSAYPPGFVQQGVGLDCLLFVQGGEHFAWALHELVRSQIFPVVVVASPLKGNDAGLELRRLQIAAKHASAVVIVAAEVEGALWPLKLRLETAREKGGWTLRRLTKEQNREALG